MLRKRNSDRARKWHTRFLKDGEVGSPRMMWAVSKTQTRAELVAQGQSTSLVHVRH